MQTCRACNSDRVIPPSANRIAYYGNSGLTALHVIVDGDPSALLMKDRQDSDLQAFICGACGHLEMFATEPAKLYDKYLEATKR